MDFIATAVILVWLVYYFVSSLLVWRQVKLMARVRFEPIDEEIFFADRDRHFKDMDRKIRSLNFDYVASSSFDNGSICNFSLYGNPKERIVATLTTIKSNAEEMTSVEFLRAFEDGFLLGVCNIDEVSIFPKIPIKTTVKFPDNQNLEELLSLLKRLGAFLNHQTAIALPRDADGYFRVVEEFVARESDELVKKGYCRRKIDPDGRRSLTLKGACLMTWKLIFPGRQIQNSIEFIDRKRLFSKLESF